MKKKKEYLAIVDKNDKLIGKATPQEVYSKGLLHRAVRVYLYNKERKYLLLKRPASKLTYPLYWEIGVAGGVKYGENYDACAKREVREETGTKALKFKLIFYSSGKLSRKDRYYAKVYAAIISSKIKPPKNEVADYKFLTKKEIFSFVKKSRLHPASKFFMIFARRGKL